MPFTYSNVVWEQLSWHSFTFLHTAGSIDLPAQRGKPGPKRKCVLAARPSEDAGPGLVPANREQLSTSTPSQAPLKTQDLLHLQANRSWEILTTALPVPAQSITDRHTTYLCSYHPASSSSGWRTKLLKGLHRAQPLLCNTALRKKPAPESELPQLPPNQPPATAPLLKYHLSLMGFTCHEHPCQHPPLPTGITQVKTQGEIPGEDNVNSN